jgi:uncharacterized protein YggL (DUF469 family)
MASSRLRKLRRLQLGATRNITATRWMGQWIVQIQFGRRLRSSRTVPKKASEKAEKSWGHTRRKRGLRRGRVRSRVCQTRRSPKPTATVFNTQSARCVNHRGRKFIWAVRTNNQFRRDCCKYLKIKKYVSNEASGRTTKSRPIGVRSRLRQRWVKLSEMAKKFDIPYQASFHRTFWDYLQIECRYDATSTWDTILAGLPRKSEPRSEVGELFSFGPSVLKSGGVTPTDEFGNSRFVEPKPLCRHCQGVGATPGPGYPKGCGWCYEGHPEFRKRHAPRRGKRPGRQLEDVKTGGRRLRRP